MKILYFTQFYTPENIAAAFRAADHAKIWTNAGHDVTVFTGWPNYPTGNLFPGYNMIRLGRELDEGVRVFRSASDIQSNTTFTNRIRSGLSFVAGGWRNLVEKNSPVGTDYDVVLVSSGTVFAAWLGVCYAKRICAPLVVEFRDLTWRQMVATGSAESNLGVRFMRSLELGMCSNASSVVALTEGFKRELCKNGISEEKLSVVPNGAELVACIHDWSGKLRLGYFGTIGISQDITRTLDLTAALYRDGLLESYVLIGEGAERASIEESLVSPDYSFATLFHGVSKEELEPQYSNVHMTVVSLQSNENFAETIPSKIFQSFARGVPVLFIGPEGEAANLIRESGGGLVLCGNNSECLAELRKFALSEKLMERLEEMSTCAVSFMERNYSRRIQAKRMFKVLLDASQDSI